ncbi:DEAD/DEAH box helicase [Zhouia sp. PK063]|uniref:DEAD/DEAH box helicase n=1 Tax=Zhouia sp. PK063 TaxID=3373602 RepID=UPI0037B51A43
MQRKSNTIRATKNGSRNKKAITTLNPRDLVQSASKEVQKPYMPSTTYEESNLHRTLKRNLVNKGYEKPTEIQEKTLTTLLAGHNVIGIASTGTGKTAAFLIPLIERMITDNTYTGLVVVPTRELAQQVHQEFMMLTKAIKVFSACFIGGTNVKEDIKKARLRHNFIVGTPGRLVDLMQQQALNVTEIKALVIDEFDCMLDMGFVKAIKSIANAMKKRQQTMLFSATIKNNQQAIVHELVGEARQIAVSSGKASSANVEQNIIKVSEYQNKFEILAELLHDHSFKKVILFTETKRGVDQLYKKLTKNGIKADVIHGNKSQNYRTKAIDLFKKGKTRVLVATDVASRGIDIDNITHVINYQIPQTMDSYIHRIGRTGRAGKKGMAYTFIN